MPCPWQVRRHRVALDGDYRVAVLARRRAGPKLAVVATAPVAVCLDARHHQRKVAPSKQQASKQARRTARRQLHRWAPLVEVAQWSELILSSEQPQPPPQQEEEEGGREGKRREGTHQVITVPSSRSAIELCMPAASCFTPAPHPTNAHTRTHTHTDASSLCSVFCRARTEQSRATQEKFACICMLG